MWGYWQCQMSDSWSQKGSALHLNISPEACSPQNRLSVFPGLGESAGLLRAHASTVKVKKQDPVSFPYPPLHGGKDPGNPWQEGTQGFHMGCLRCHPHSGLAFQHCPQWEEEAVWGCISPSNSPQGEGRPASPGPHPFAALLWIPAVPLLSRHGGKTADSAAHSPRKSPSMAAVMLRGHRTVNLKLSRLCHLLAGL